MGWGGGGGVQRRLGTTPNDEVMVGSQNIRSIHRGAQLSCKLNGSDVRWDRPRWDRPRWDRPRSEVRS